MADMREYVTQKTGDGILHISEEVIATVAAMATADVEGVGELISLDHMNKKTRCVKVTASEKQISIDLWMRVRFGYSIPTVAKKVQSAVIEAVDSMTGMRTKAVRIHVSGIDYPAES